MLAVQKSDIAPDIIDQTGSEGILYLSKNQAKFMMAYLKCRAAKRKLKEETEEIRRQKLSRTIEKLEKRNEKLIATGVSPLLTYMAFKKIQRLRRLNILSCGAGMQSTAVALMSCENRLAGRMVHRHVPIYDAILFCDLGCEPRWVYHQVNFIKSACEQAGIPFYILDDNNLYDIYMQTFGKSRTVGVPFWSIGPDGKKAKMRRRCTIDLKILIMQKFVRHNLLGYPKGALLNVLDYGCHYMHIGFSKEEMQRVFTSQNEMFKNKFPLIEMDWERPDTYRYNLERWGLDTKGSACIICPFHKNYFYEYLKEWYSEDYKRVLAFDKLLEEQQPNTPIKSALYLSPSRKRIKDLEPEECRDAQVFKYNNLLVWNGF